MASRKFVSPGVFTNEIDASFLPQAVGEIGAAIIGTFPKGPAFVPMTVSNFDEFTTHFGGLDTDHIASFAARGYLKNSSTANIVRVLGPSGRTVNGSAVEAGYTAESMWGIMAVTGSATAKLQALIEITGSADLIVNDLASDEFDLRISGTDGYIVSVTASFNSGSANYISRVLNTDPTKFSTSGYYLRDVYQYAFQDTNNGQAIYVSKSFGTMTDFTNGYQAAYTPMIKSQEFGGSTTYDLFRFYSLGHGEAENGRFKVSITNITPSPVPSVSEFGKFDVEVRAFGDKDDALSVVERFAGCTLNPNDKVNFIKKRIGDRYWAFDQNEEKMVPYGDYENQSSYVRIVMTTSDYPDSALPWGFEGLAKPDLSFISGSAGAGDFADGTDLGEFAASDTLVIDDLPYVNNLTDKKTGAEYNSRWYWGVEFDRSGSIDARLTLLPSMTGSDAAFSLTYVSGNSLDTFVYNPSNPAASKKSPSTSDGHTTLSNTYAKFTVPLAFGFDGWDRRVENPIQNETQLLTVSQLGTQALRQAVDIVSDPDFIDINLLTLPGIHSDKVVEYAISAVEDRADCFYLMDITASSTATAVSSVVNRGFDTNYAAAYYPDVKVSHPDTGAAIRVPASVAALGAIAYNDRVAQPWFAPAGLNRGGLNANTFGYTVLNSVDRLNAANRNSLYENRINPIASFPGQGHVVWGQKTLQVAASALDRVNVRRLLIRAKKLIASATRFLVFEPNNGATQTRFKQLVNPILADIQQKQGLEQFKVVMDETTNPPSVIDQNQLVGKIFLVPQKSAEFISLDFVISPSGASFEG
jgi:hypothetical protein